MWPLRRSKTSAPERRPARPLRVERFGAITELDRPRALVFVDRALARRLGARGSAAWLDPDGDGDVGGAPLSAPLEAHLQLTNRCEVGCQGCYTGATPAGAPREWGAVEWMRAIDALADRGVFHLALGGGESATLPWLGEVAAHARRRGLTPNLTTSGLYGLDGLLPIAHLFGQINVSIDGLGPTYAAVRGIDGFAEADRAIRRLRERKREIGINIVVTRVNFGELDELLAYARRRRLNEVELLRFKPAGRGAAAFAHLTCSDAQHRAFWPLVRRAARRHRVRVRLDCSYTPMLVHHRPPRRLLEELAVYGCTAGDFLIGAKASGALCACSFAPAAEGRPSLDQIGDYWDRPDAFGAFRQWRDPDEPCRSCEYHRLCRGGCKAVSLHLRGDASRPDPECPRVVDHRAAEAGAGRVRLPVVM
ncbi:MAG TPA: radical SAM protein [Kofleriaceae bacterium]|nr:radical SAM protein [Kofleriaceae bacterium]